MPDKLPQKRILVIHGPNLNMLGQREPEIYGHQSLDEINAQLLALAEKLGLALEIFQSNHEGDIVDRIQQSVGTCEGILTGFSSLWGPVKVS
jgi:3-dehydroquinate dehydratase-2